MLILIATAPREPAPQREHAAITQEETAPPTLPKTKDTDVDKWRQLAEGGDLGPSPPLLPTYTVPQQGPDAAPQVSRRAPSTLKEVCAAQHGSRSLATYTHIFNLLKTYTTPEAKYCLKTLIFLALKERPPLLTVAAGPPSHVLLLWGVERLLVLFTNPEVIYGKIVAFSRDMVEGTFPPTITINPTWWYMSSQLVISAATAAQSLANCTPAATEIPALTTANYRAHLPLAVIAPLQFVKPLLSAPYLSPTAVYTFLTAHAAEMRWEEKMELLIPYLLATLLPSFLSATALLLLKLADHVTVSRKRLLQMMLPMATPVVSEGAPTIIMQAPQLMQQPQDKNKDATTA